MNVSFQNHTDGSSIPAATAAASAHQNNGSDQAAATTNAASNPTVDSVVAVDAAVEVSEDCIAHAMRCVQGALMWNASSRRRRGGATAVTPSACGGGDSMLVQAIRGVLADETTTAAARKKPDTVDTNMWNEVVGYCRKHGIPTQAELIVAASPRVDEEEEVEAESARRPSTPHKKNGDLLVTHQNPVPAEPRHQETSTESSRHDFWMNLMSQYCPLQQDLATRKAHVRQFVAECRSVERRSHKNLLQVYQRIGQCQHVGDFDVPRDLQELQRQLDEVPSDVWHDLEEYVLIWSESRYRPELGVALEIVEVSDPEDSTLDDDTGAEAWGKTPTLGSEEYSGGEEPNAKRRKVDYSIQRGIATAEESGDFSRKHNLDHHQQQQRHSSSEKRIPSSSPGLSCDSGAALDVPPQVSDKTTCERGIKRPRNCNGLALRTETDSVDLRENASTSFRSDTTNSPKTLVDTVGNESAKVAASDSLAEMNSVGIKRKSSPDQSVESIAIANSLVLLAKSKSDPRKEISQRKALNKSVEPLAETDSAAHKKNEPNEPTKASNHFNSPTLPTETESVGHKQSLSTEASNSRSPHAETDLAAHNNNAPNVTINLAESPPQQSDLVAVGHEGSAPTETSDSSTAQVERDSSVRKENARGERTGGCIPEIPDGHKESGLTETGVVASAEKDQDENGKLVLAVERIRKQPPTECFPLAWTESRQQLHGTMSTISHDTQPKRRRRVRHGPVVDSHFIRLDKDESTSDSQWVAYLGLTKPLFDKLVKRSSSAWLDMFPSQGCVQKDVSRRLLDCRATLALALTLLQVPWNVSYGQRQFGLPTPKAACDFADFGASILHDVVGPEEADYGEIYSLLQKRARKKASRSKTKEGKSQDRPEGVLRAEEHPGIVNDHFEPDADALSRTNLITDSSKDSARQTSGNASDLDLGRHESTGPLTTSILEKKSSAPSLTSAISKENSKNSKAASLPEEQRRSRAPRVRVVDSPWIRFDKKGASALEWIQRVGFTKQQFERLVERSVDLWRLSFNSKSGIPKDVSRRMLDARGTFALALIRLQFPVDFSDLRDYFGLTDVSSYASFGISILSQTVRPDEEEYKVLSHLLQKWEEKRSKRVAAARALGNRTRKDGNSEEKNGAGACFLEGEAVSQGTTSTQLPRTDASAQLESSRHHAIASGDELSSMASTEVERPRHSTTLDFPRSQSEQRLIEYHRPVVHSPFIRVDYAANSTERQWISYLGSTKPPFHKLETKGSGLWYERNP